MCTDKVVAFCLYNRTVNKLSCRTESLKALEMLVNRTHTKVTAARKSHLSPAVLAQKCAEKIV